MKIINVHALPNKVDLLTFLYNLGWIWGISLSNGINLTEWFTYLNILQIGLFEINQTEILLK